MSYPANPYPAVPAPPAPFIGPVPPQQQQPHQQQQQVQQPPPTSQAGYGPGYPAYPLYGGYPPPGVYPPAQWPPPGMNPIPMSGPQHSAAFTSDGNFSPERYLPEFNRGLPRFAGNSQHVGQPMGDHYGQHYSYAPPPHYSHPPPHYGYPGHDQGGAFQGPYNQYGGGGGNAPNSAAAYPMHPGYGSQNYASEQPGRGAYGQQAQRGYSGNRNQQNSNLRHQPVHRGGFRGNHQGNRNERFQGNRGGASTSNPRPAPVKSLPNVRPDNKRKRKGPHKKKEGNALGLTPTVDEDGIASESEEEIDEEVAFEAKDGTSEELQFEHKGRAFDLTSKDELTAWLEERKRNYPTRARAEAKAKDPLFHASGSNSIQVLDSNKRKRDGTEDHGEVPQSKKAKQAPIEGQECLQFRDQAVCMRGKRCFYIHKMPDGSVVSSEALGNPRSGALRNKKAAEERARRIGTNRKSLFEIMRESEQKEEDELVVRAIKDLGDRGFFKETKSMDVVMLAVESVNKMSLSSGPIIEVVEENGKPSAELKDNGASVKLNGAQSVSSPAATSQTQQDEHEEGEHEKKTADTESDAIIKAEDTSDSKTGGDEANNFAVEEVSVVN